MKFFESRDEGWVALGAFAVAGAVALLDLRTILSHFMVDDSFYYLEIARNVSLGKGFTFDGLHATNGFQPLFQLLLVPVFWLTTDNEAAIRVAKLLEALIFAVGAVLLYRLVLKWGLGRGAAWMALAVLILPGPYGHPLAKGLFTGMESGVNFLMLLLLLHMWQASLRGRDQIPFVVAYGLVIALAFLARLDNIFLIAGLAAGHGYMLRKGAGPRLSRLLLAAMISVVVCGAYLLWNELQFGNAVPISGRAHFMVSQRRSAQLLEQGLLPWIRNTAWFVFHLKSVAVLPLLGLILVPALVLFQRWVARLHSNVWPRDDARAVLLWVLWISSVIRIGYYAVFQQYPGSGVFWYYVQEVIVIALCAGVGFRWLFDRLKIERRAEIARLLSLGLLSISLVFILNTKPVFDWEVASFEATQEIRGIVSEGDVLGAKDAGVLGYFLPNSVVNLDGLVNDARYYEYLKAGRVDEYILQEDIRYLLNLSAPSGTDMLTALAGAHHVKLVYASGSPVASHGNWIYKLYRVIP